MVKQSDFFQRIIAGVERQLAAEGVQVTESAKLYEQTSKASREVDVLIEGTLNDHPVRIAVECRDHAERQDVTWIDALIGKYRDVQISLVVAVSSSGFTEAGLAKADSVGIRTIHFTEAIASGATPIPPLQLRLFRQSNRMTEVTVRLKPPLDDPSAWVPLSTPLWDAGGTPHGDFRGLLESVYRGDIQAVVQGKLSESLEGLVAAGPNPTLRLSVGYGGGGLFMHGEGGKRHELVEFICEVLVSVEFITGKGKDYQYGRQRVFVGTADIGRGRQVAVTAVRIPEGDAPFRLAHWEVSSSGGLLIRGH